MKVKNSAVIALIQIWVLIPANRVIMMIIVIKKYFKINIRKTRLKML